jgi:signal transduction histidine kinase
VGDEIRRIDELVNEFLEFARPRQLEKNAESLKTLCERAIRLVSSTTTPDVKIDLDLPAGDVTIEVDAAKTEQMLSNLLENAVDAVASAGGGHISLRARRQPRSVSLEVEDDGPGLAAPDAPIFDAFYSTKPHGAGLGLAVAHRIVSNHGGTIDVTSRPGKTVFTVTLPLHLG